MSNKFSKNQVGYENPAKGMDHCRDCEHYLPGACELVEGSIAPGAWCREFDPITRLAKRVAA